MRHFTSLPFFLAACGALCLVLVGADCEGGPPGGGEICGDGVDNDNDGAIDEGEDADDDGYLTCDIATLIDCDDEDPNVHPEQADACDGLDTNCDEVVDNVDVDADGWIDSACGGADCDDADPSANPESNEACDGADNDCDGEIDEGFDADDDGWSFCGPDGVPGNTDDDCSDGNPEVNPDADEVCDGVDNDCDNKVDEDFDADGDGFIDRSNPNCSDLYGVGAPFADQGDCDDTDDVIRPGAHEDPSDATDNDCDGCTDECEDFDGDGWDNCDDTDAGDPNCAHDTGNDGQDADCLDVAQDYNVFAPVFSHLTQQVFPGYMTNVACEMSTVAWPEQCDSVDNNCDGRIDEGFDAKTCNPTAAICPE